MSDRVGVDAYDDKVAQGLIRAQDKMQGGVDEFLGIRITSFEAGRMIATFEVRDELLTPIGNLHGGCIAALVDHCLGTALYPHMPRGYWAATTEFKLNYLRPVSKGTCTATTDIVSMTRRSAVVRITVANEGRDVCLAQGTCTVVAPRGGDAAG